MKARLVTIAGAALAVLGFYWPQAWVMLAFLTGYLIYIGNKRAPVSRDSVIANIPSYNGKPALQALAPATGIAPTVPQVSVHPEPSEAVNARPGVLLNAAYDPIRDVHPALKANRDWSKYDQPTFVRKHGLPPTEWFKPVRTAPAHMASPPLDQLGESEQLFGEETPDLVYG